MVNKNLEIKLKQFEDFFYRFSHTYKSTTELINLIISKNGNTMEITSLLQELNKMKVDEFELLIFMLDELSTDEDFEKFENLSLKEDLEKTKGSIKDLISNFKSSSKDLEELKRKSILSNNKSYKKIPHTQC